MADRLPISLLRDPVHLAATGLGVGLMPKAPGTFGSALAILPAWLMLSLTWQLKLGIALAVFVCGIWVCGESARRLERHDHPAIVLDEIAAMLMLTLVVPLGIFWLLIAFLLFRVFDIFKPWPIRDMDHRIAGGLGIMLDDQMAAVYTAACLFVIRVYFGTS